ncbi:pimeloyl-ACP methyl ester carboxylesterase [Amycolatopsis bartoniae]|uniref:Alpha/beta hydrolase n=1 Tax=Amycolatopsis bartoniae TaxID=941986 RepID=A0A8H9IXC0_9PSEU|nr:alpha/beta hydrolase [Amycolatopsis bartoniae]MBB2936276.1 pimeloyl-ACP methyl ester carboxylesterase [Amycolatopsis bartoniae]TVT11566.1 alpha/beta hydrolase [Amycolatopsis bartoniae]GHF79034.1 alpha/beta hydrolase [Amycolatopsis bartoniae]
MTVPKRTTTNREVQRPHDTTIRYTISGPAEGPTLAFIHGWGCNRRDFDAVIGFLPAHYRVLAIDLAEHGESRSTREVWTMEEFARDVAAVLAAEAVVSCAVVGHSLGGAVAVETGRILPEVVSHVIALDALHYLSLFPAQDEQQAHAVLQPFREDFAAAMRGMVEAGSPEGTDPALNDAYFAKMVTVRQPAGLRSLEGLVHWDMDAALREVTRPVTLFAVRSILSQEAIERYGDRIHIVPVDLGTHHFHVESPEGTAELLVDTLSE